MGQNNGMKKCPYCQATTRQNKAGKTVSGSQRYRCMHCQRKYTPKPKQHGYSPDLRKRAVKMYVDGGNFRRIARHLGVNHQTVVNWVTAHAETLPEAPVPENVNEAEMDELFTFIGSKKTQSTSSRSQIAKRAAFWAGLSFGLEPSKRSSIWLMKRPKQNGITVMALMPINGSGITLADMKSHEAKPIHTQLKQTMLNCVITWHVWLADRVASLAVHMH